MQPLLQWKSNSECVLVALGIQPAMCTCHIVMVRMALQHFSTLSHKEHGFFWGGGTIIEHKMCVLIFSTNSVSNIFHSKKN